MSGCDSDCRVDCTAMGKPSELSRDKDDMERMVGGRARVSKSGVAN